MSVIPTLYYDPGLEPRNVCAALVWGLNMPGCAKTESVPQFLSELLDSVRAAGEEFISPARKSAVRAMLRFRKYKPAGRSKPSSEYLLAAALQSDFPLVNGPVDVNNAVSLQWGYPASIFDINLCGTDLLLRRGLPGEAYIFNPSGQIIDLEDLLCVCRREGETWQPCGNPVKDAMATKIGESTRGVAAVIYAPLPDPKEDIESAAARFAALLLSECGASESGWVIPQIGLCPNNID
jgi:DNA/RNA-binding domain of Phe-tRNA-synthetase-like protein